MNKEILEQLAAPLEVKIKPGGGGFKYVDNRDVIERVNNIFKGNWTTEVRSQEIIEDSVLIRVTVRYYDPETDTWCSHEGYGSSAIARFKSGPNQGKPTDIGNTYKGALAKAITYACTRLGVGLNLEEVAAPATAAPIVAPPVQTVQTVATPAAIPSTPVTAPVTAPVAENPALPAFPTTEVVAPPARDIPSIPVQEAPVAVPVTAPPVEVPVVPVQEAPVVAAPVEPTTPPVQAAPAVVPPVEEVSAPVIPVATPQEAPVIPVNPAPPAAAPVNTPPVPETRPANVPLDPAGRIKQRKEANAQPPQPVNTRIGERISDVQLAALQGVLSVRGLNYEELAAEAIADAGRTLTPIPPKEELTYEDAVTIIKYGNEKNRKG